MLEIVHTQEVSVTYDQYSCSQGIFYHYPCASLSQRITMQDSKGSLVCLVLASSSPEIPPPCAKPKEVLTSCLQMSVMWLHMTCPGKLNTLS